MKRNGNNTRRLSLFLILCLVIGLVQLPFPEKVRAEEGWYGECITDFDKNTVTFKYKADDNGYAFVAGAFNNWEPWEHGDKYKLNWKDTGSNYWMMVGEIFMDDLGKPATKEAYQNSPNCDYKFVIVNGQDKKWRNKSGNDGANDSFAWMEPQDPNTPPAVTKEISSLNVEVAEANKTVTFTAEAVGYSKVRIGYYLPGSGSDTPIISWENYEMTADTEHPTTFKKTFDFTGKPNGTYQFKFSLLPQGASEANENWEWYKSDKSQGSDNSTFVWNGTPIPPAETVADFTLISSSNEVAEDFPVEFVAVKEDALKNREVVEGLTFEIENDISDDGIFIPSGSSFLNVDSRASVGTTITVKAYSPSEPARVAKKTVTVRENASLNGKTLLHYFSQDKNYEGWNNWVFKGENPGYKVDFTGDSDLGKAAAVTLGSKVIVRKHHGGNDWAEQTKAYTLPDNEKNTYIIKDDNELYTSLKDAYLAAGPRVRAAMMDSESEIRAYLTETPLPGVNFKLYKNDVEVQGVNSGISGTTLTLSGITDFDPTALYEVKADNMFRLPREVTKRLVLNSLTYGGKMGVNFEEEDVNFRIWAPTAHAVELLLYDSHDVDRANPSQVFSLTHDTASGTYFITKNKSEVNNKYYLYRLTFKTRSKGGNVSERQTYAVDPYAIATGLNGKKGYITDINDESLKPDGWDNDTKPALKNPEDSIIYEMHVRDFTIAPSWTGTEANRGKFLGVAEAGTTYTSGNETVKTGLDHLEELGVTHVHLLPVYDIASIEENGNQGFNAKKSNGTDFNRNWGYDPQNYNALEGSYATDPSNPTEVIKEFRTMVQALHKKGIRVVLDQVFNHMYSTENMDNIVPGYYFRTDDLGKFTDGAGCGNEVATERPMVSKFIVDSNKMWLNHYKVDGLRFDLMALIDKGTMNKVQSEAKKIDQSIIVYGEPWEAAYSPLPHGDRTYKGNEGIGAFNDTYRDALRGNNSPSKGYIQGVTDSDKAGKVHEGLKGSVNGTVNDPELMINYVEAHDNYAIFDQVEKTDAGVASGSYRQNISANPLLDWRVNKTLLGNGFVLTSQGIPFFQGGSEILRTKQGDHNSYKSDDTTNAIHWEDKVTYKKVFDFYKDLIQIRRDHPAFRMTTKADIQGNQEVNRLMNHDGMIYNLMKNNAGGDKWKNVLVIYNATIENKEADWLPKAAKKKWTLLFDKSGLVTEEKVLEQVNDSGSLKEKLIIPASSFMIFYDEEGKADNIQWDYLFADQSIDYMEPLEPGAADNVKVRFRAAAGEVTSAKVHYYDEADNSHKEVEMTKITEASFYTDKGYDATELEFWEGIIPASENRKYYNFEVKNGTKSAWISGGKGENNRGVTENNPSEKGFWIVPDYKTPDWTKESVFYQIMVDRFRDGDTKNNRVAKDVSQFGHPSEVSAWGSEVYNGNESDGIWNNQFFGGDLIGVKEALPYLTYLGVDSLYLMPIFQSGSDHKYDTDDYKYVDKNFGGNKALSDLSAEMKKKGMRLVLDGVFNHTSTEGELFKNHKNNYYFFGEKEYRDGNGQPIDFYAWHGYTNLAKLNFSKEEVKNLIYKGDDSVAKHYLKAPYSIDGWRLDAAEDVNTEPRDYKSNSLLDIKTSQTSEEQKAANLAIWKEFRAEVKKTNPNAFILGEFWEDDNQWYKERAWDSKMNYGGFMMPFIENNSGNPYKGRQSLDNKGEASVADIGKYTRDYFTKFPYQTILTATNSISTHDKERFLNREFTGEGNAAMMQLASALQMTYPGVPMIYYGDEIGLRGKNNGKDPYNRGTFNWNVSSWNGASKQMFKDHKTLIAARKLNKNAFVYGAFEEIASHNENKYIAYARYGKNNRTITILNNKGGEGSQSIHLTKLSRYGFKDGDVLHDVLSNQTVSVVNGEATFPSKNMSASVWVSASHKPSALSGDIDFANEDFSDPRTKLSKVSNAVMEVKGNEISVSWDVVKEDAAKEILVGIYEGNKRVMEQTVEKNLTRAVFQKDASLSENFSVEIRVIADRTKKGNSDLTSDDGFADSDFVTAVKKADEFGGSGNGGGYIALPEKESKAEEKKEAEPSARKPEEEKETKTEAEEREKKAEAGTTKPSEGGGETIAPSEKERVVFVEKAKNQSASISKKNVSEVLSGEAEKLIVEVKNGTVSFDKTALKKLLGNVSKKLSVHVSRLSEKSEKGKGELGKIKKNSLLKKEVFDISLKADGKSLKKVDLGKTRFTVALKVSLKKIPKELYVFDLKSGKLIKAKYNKKQKEVVFKTGKTGRYVLVRKTTQKKAKSK